MLSASKARRNVAQAFGGMPTWARRYGPAWCPSCSGEAAMGARVRWICIGDVIEGVRQPEEWEYACNDCRTLQILAGDDNREWYDLGDF